MITGYAAVLSGRRTAKATSKATFPNLDLRKSHSVHGFVPVNTSDLNC